MVIYNIYRWDATSLHLQARDLASLTRNNCTHRSCDTVPSVTTSEWGREDGTRVSVAPQRQASPARAWLTALITNQGSIACQSCGPASDDRSSASVAVVTVIGVSGLSDDGPSHRARHYTVHQPAHPLPHHRITPRHHHWWSRWGGNYSGLREYSLTPPSYIHTAYYQRLVLAAISQ